jgi:hypothetical protein
VVINDRLEEATDALVSIIRAEMDVGGLKASAR